jgi:hypothetical protein
MNLDKITACTANAMNDLVNAASKEFQSLKIINFSTFPFGY